MNLEEIPYVGFMPRIHPDVFWYYVVSVVLLLMIFYVHARWFR